MDYTQFKPTLPQQLKDKAYEYGIHKQEIPEYITQNLKYEFFDWQNKALEEFLLNELIKKRENPNKPNHLMFNMATGTGKTMIMASLILYYYKQGYRYFLFFVNQNNIVDKTENNFINTNHTKYLYKEKIVIDNKTVNIKKVDSFSDNPQEIEIKFTSIQKLYNDIHIEKENRTTLTDLHTKNIVMLADEAHHLNTETQRKNGGQKEADFTELTDRSSVKDIEKKGWEHTVINLILNKNDTNIENKNVLLEFTATVPATESIAKKYEDKIIYQFGLKEFLQAGYTKEINLVSSTLDKKERVLQALLFQWYRHKIALKNNIPNFKPVILFRSKTIEESNQHYEEFLNWMDVLTSKDFDFLKRISTKIAQSTSPYEQGKSRMEQVLKFIENEKINYSEIANFIKQSFAEKNVIITNSKTNKTKKEKTDEETEKLLNSLEDSDNNIRAIFTVNRLTEGWDVLNLFDIVRLYQGQNAGGSTTKTPEATIQEKQLIGRGVRYFPFPYKDNEQNKRKFDNDIQNELRILEELFYYTYDEDSKYISHLKQELKRDGYIRDNRITKTFDLKKEFKESNFYKNTKIWHNKQIDNPNRKKKNLKDIKKDFFTPYKIKNLEISEQEIDFENQEDLERLSLQEKGLRTETIKVKDVEKHIFLKAINIKAKSENSLFQYNQLKKELAIKSIEDLQKKDFLGDFNITIIMPKNFQYDDIPSKEKLEIIIKFLESIFAELQDKIAPKIGSEFIPANFKKFFNKPKTKVVDEDEESQKITEELQKENWYILDNFVGTSEEKSLVEFIKQQIGNLEEEFKEIYLLRNEEIYKIYDFEKGRGFQPDFILFLKSNKKEQFELGIGEIKDYLFYQIFIEPKGNNYIGNDGTFKTGKEGWKEEFLEEITEKYGLEKVIKAENPNYRLIGLPFFNQDHNDNFHDYYKKITNEKSNNTR